MDKSEFINNKGNSWKSEAIYNVTVYDINGRKFNADTVKVNTETKSRYVKVYVVRNDGFSMRVKHIQTYQELRMLVKVITNKLI